MNDHEFNLTVKSSGTRDSASMAVLAAFASRQPDGCSFHLSEAPYAPPIEPLHKLLIRLAASEGARRAISEIQTAALSLTQAARVQLLRAILDTIEP